jgi:RHS repeat-associated protein
VYDGWRVIQERDTNNTPLVSYTRGNDLSGSLEGAGGIGGLLARAQGYASTNGNWYTHNIYHPDGNGNITYLVDSSQALAASYRYDPYGNLISSSGTLAGANVYRFSSKEIHANSGMYYYGYRFYDPNLQRWLNRDPIDEEGGINLYEFVRNDPLKFADLWGLKPGDKFDTSEDAAKDACNYIHEPTKKKNKEHGGWVYKKDGKFTYDEPMVGDKDSVNMGTKPDGASAMFHSHTKGEYSENFSGAKGNGWKGAITRHMGIGDVFSADQVGLPSYLDTPNGDIKRYDPDPKKGGNGTITTLPKK